VPDWLSIGVAQNLFLALRTRNSQVVIRRWLKNEDLPLSDIVNLEHLPAGRWGEKAFCGLALDWFASCPEPAVVFENFFSCLAGGSEITTNGIGNLWMGRDSGRELEISWDLWVASQMQVKQYWGGITLDRLESLRHLLAAPPDEMGIPSGEGVPASLAIQELVEYRDAPWMPLYAGRLNLHIRGLGIGEAKEFRDVLELFGQYLDALARPRSGLRRLSLFRASPDALNRMLSNAEKGLAALEANWEQKNQYVIGVEAAVRDGMVVPASVSNTIADMQRFIPPAELKRYRDSMNEGTSP
jgi:hypothetical protein